MAVLVRCGACGADFRAQSRFRGDRAPCPTCRQPLVIEGASIPDYDVFISYSSSDKLAADALCAALEAKRWRCWIAPRDVVAGSDWGGAIIDAIERSRLMVLVYSSHANQSQQVIREVERSVSKGVPIIPFRIEATPPTKSMEYFLSSSHWLDAMTRPLEEHLEDLGQAVGALLKSHPELQSTESKARPAEAAAADATSARPAEPTAPAAAAQAPIAPRPTPRATAGRLGAAAAVALVLALVVVVVVVRPFRQRGPGGGVAMLPAPIAPPGTPTSGPSTAPSAAAPITRRTVLVPKQRFNLRVLHREERIPVSVPPIASGSGTLEIILGDMGDDSGDGGMTCLLLDSRGEPVLRRFSKKRELITHEVTSNSTWTIVLRDTDTTRKGNIGSIEVAVVPK